GTSTPAGGDGVLYVNAPTMGSDTYNATPLPAFSSALEKYDQDKDGKLSFDGAGRGLSKVAARPAGEPPDSWPDPAFEQELKCVPSVTSHSTRSLDRNRQ
ncbi:MAG TPA: hypothetical protein DEH78_13460, partial [Solibacterales bacterium]|nr:hypothetical protein [Bryobacterales bacterium]